MSQPWRGRGRARARGGKPPQGDLPRAIGRGVFESASQAVSRTSLSSYDSRPGISRSGPGLSSGPNHGPRPGPNSGPSPSPRPGPNSGPNPSPRPGPNSGPSSSPRPGPNSGLSPSPRPGPSSSTRSLLPGRIDSRSGARTDDIGQRDKLLQTPTTNLVSKRGTIGTPVKLMANYFTLETVPNWRLYHYHISFNPPDEDRISVRKQLIRDRVQQLTANGGYLFDGSSLFLHFRLPQDNFEFVAIRATDDTQFKVGVKFANDLHPSDPHYLQVFGILMRKCFQNLDLKLIGRNYFDPRGQTDISNYNLSLIPGYISSIRQHERDILMCAEITTKVMRKDTALELAREYQKKHHDEFKKAIIGTSVMTNYNHRHYRIDDVDYSVNPKSSFATRNGDVTFIQYYKSKYGIEIGDPYQPLLVSMSSPRELRSGQPDFIYLVPELCQMTGLTEGMITNMRLMRAVADVTRVNPDQRVERLRLLNERLHSQPKVTEDLKKWNLTLSDDLVTFKGRKLPSCKIITEKFNYEVDDRVDWTNQLRSNPMFYSRAITKFVVLVPQRMQDNARGFIQCLSKAADGMKFKIAPAEVVIISGENIADYVRGIDSILDKGQPEMLLTFCSNNRPDRYAAIKKKCYVNRAVANQIVLDKSTQNKNTMSIATKIVIQMNCKIGGAPWALNIPLKGTMVVGFDVNHDSCKKELSFGALVASLNNTFSRYFSAVSAHKTGNELSVDFATLLRGALVCWKSNNNSLPSQIIIYRDGVGEGQLSHVKETEVSAVKEMLKRMYGTEKGPQLIVVVVTKRINTRIFTDEKEKKNPPPGTVVDDVITCPHKYDFFLVSQKVRQGTVSPTAYNVIVDESNLSTDNLQRLTYYLTHLYYNWTGTVRVPAPCQYAHKLAFLVGAMLHQEPDVGMNSLLYFL